MRARARLAAAGLAALLALALTPGRAVAIDPIPSPWPAAPCATGAVTETSAAIDANGLWSVSVGGWVQPCTPATLPAAYFAVRYHETAAVVISVLWPLGWTEGRRYESATGPTHFTAEATLGFAPGRYGPLRAICVARTPEDPLACTGVDQAGESQPPVFSPVEITDPRVTSVPLVRERVDRVQTDPGCGSCI